MEVLILLVLLTCPIVMGTMMLLMWRGMRSHRNGERAPDDAAQPQEVMTDDRKESARR